MCITTFYFGRTTAAQYVNNLQCFIMFFNAIFSFFILIGPVFGQVVLNDTGHTVENGDGVAHSSVHFERQFVDGDGRLTFVNGHNHPVSENQTEAKIAPLKNVVETQQTTCQVTTEQLVATAQATVTRVLKGLCTTEELERQFQLFTALLTDRLNQLSQAVLKIDERVDGYNEALKLGKYQQIETLVPSCREAKTAATTLSGSESRQPSEIELEKQLSNSQENDAIQQGIGVREPEIQKYNSTIHIELAMSGSPKRVFTYYWKIPNAEYLLSEMNPKRWLRSSSFYIYQGGYRMFLRCFPRQTDENFSLHVGLTKGDFDEVLKWPFAHKMRVTILDQTHDRLHKYEDLSSTVWDPSQLCSAFNWQQPKKGDNFECVGLGLPIDILRQRDYVANDCLVIKLTVYLDI